MFFALSFVPECKDFQGWFILNVLSHNSLFKVSCRVNLFKREYIWALFTCLTYKKMILDKTSLLVKAQGMLDFKGTVTDRN